MTSPPAAKSAAATAGRAFALLTVLFFLWGFLTSLNDVLVGYFKKQFELSDLQANLVQFAFFGAYFVGSAIYFAISILRGDPIQRMGYQKALVIGLLLAAVGALMFDPAAELASFNLALCALFVLALGVTLIQISANPYVAALGPPESASSRLNLAQGFNSVGTVLGPLLGGLWVFGTWGGDTSDRGLDAVVLPYLIIACTMVALAVVFSVVRLPTIQKEAGSEAGGPSDRSSGRPSDGGSIFAHRQLAFGIVAIFLYVGAEVSIGSNLIRFLGLPSIAGFSEEQASPYVSVYWGGLMIGRFLGAISLSSMPPGKKLGAMFGSAALGYLALAGSLSLGRKLPYGDMLELMVPYLGFLGLSLGTFFLGRGLPGATTALFALAAVGLLTTGILTEGSTALWCVIGAGLCNAVMWSNIFTLAIAGLGRHTSQGSSLLVMAIVGGALLPLAQGALSDLLEDPQAAMVIPAAAYLYIAWYGWRATGLVRLSEASA